MAIFDKIIVEVQVDGQPLEEFEKRDDEDSDTETDDDDDAELVERYIQSHPGKNYTIVLRLQKDFKFNETREWDAVSFDVSVDGQWIENTLCAQEEFLRDSSFSVTVSGKEHYGTTSYLQKFRFKALDDGNLTHSGQNYIVLMT